MRAFDIPLFAQSDEALNVLAKEFYSHFSGGISTISGRLKVQILAEGTSGVAAAERIICDLEEKLPIQITGVDQDLVDIAEISRRVEKTRQAVQQWVVNGLRGSVFPDAIGFPGGKRILAWYQVHEWLTKVHPELADPWAMLSRDESLFVENWLIARRPMHASRHQIASARMVMLTSGPVVQTDQSSVGTIINARVVA